jgi:zinc transport system permease protein
VGVFFVFATPGTVPELNSFLFGNILTITSASLWAFGLYTVALVALMAGAYRQVVAVSFDRDFATVIGLRVKLLSTTLTAMVAVGIVLMIRCVGIMLLMSMLTMPQLTAELFTRRYGAMMRGAIVVSVISSVGGLLLSTVIDVPTAAFIVFLQVIIYAVAAAVRAIIRR